MTLPSLTYQEQPIDTPIENLQTFLLAGLGSDTHPNHRELLRQVLKKHLGVLTDPGNWSQQPIGSNFYSLSHEKQSSLIALSKAPVGCDIVSNQRCSTKLLQRVSEAQEIQEAPSMPHLWVAKESALKSLLKKDVLLSQLKIHQWEKSQQGFSFLASLQSVDNVVGQGWTCLNMDQTLAFFERTLNFP